MSVDPHLPTVKNWNVIRLFKTDNEVYWDMFTVDIFDLFWYLHCFTKDVCHSN